MSEDSPYSTITYHSNFTMIVTILQLHCYTLWLWHYESNYLRPKKTYFDGRPFRGLRGLLDVAGR